MNGLRIRVLKWTIYYIIIKIFNGEKNHAFTNKGAYNNVNFTSKNGFINDSNIFFFFHIHLRIILYMCVFFW